MESFVWGAHFITGLTTVDRQHRRLIELLNRFGTALACNQDMDGQVKIAFREMADYARVHFRDEERLMAERGVDFRHRQAHFQEHKNFFKDAGTQASGLDQGCPEEDQGLLAFLIQWVAYHILGSDQKMARQMRAIEAGMTPEAAYEKEEQRESAPTEALLTALNNLYQQVAKRNRKLIEFNLCLEEKVSERTAQLKEANRHLTKLALTDTLTDLPNRRFAMDRLKQLWTEARGAGQPLSCMMIDADGFKTVNDTFGHDAGDQVLVRLARELKYAVRTDDMVARLGGDEFFIICPATPLNGALHLAEQVRSRVAALEVAAGSGAWKGSISVGVACTHPDLKGIDALIKSADEGVYLAKANGRNCVMTPHRSSHGTSR